jgi:hypothetical protein
MRQTYRIIGWAALLAALSNLGQPVVVALTPAVFGTSEMVTDPAILRGAAWLAFLEGGIFLGVAVGVGFLVLGMDELLGSARSVAGSAHIVVGIAAAFGWLLVASASLARYSSVTGAASSFGEEGRSVFFQGWALSLATGLLLASIASGIWWIGTAVRGLRAGVLGRPLAVFAGLVGALNVLASLLGIPWLVLLQIPLFIVLGIVFLRRAGRLASTPRSTETAPA